MTDYRFFSISEINLFHHLLKWHKEESKKTIETVAHYFPDTEVLNQILTTGILRASNIYFLNDWQEHKKGLDFLIDQVFIHQEYKQTKKVLESIKAEWLRKNVGIYSISFATDADNLQHWVTYAKNTGICIELDYEYMKEEVDYFQKFNNESFTNSVRCPLAQIAYISKGNEVDKHSLDENTLLDSKLVLEYFTKLVEDLFSKTGLSNNHQKLDKLIVEEYKLQIYLIALATYYKEGSFVGEKEVRASFFPYSDPFGKNKIHYHRMENGILRPYIEILIGKKIYEKDENEKPVPAIPIFRITVSPGDVQSRMFESIIHRVEYGDTSGIWKDDDKEFIKKQKSEFDKAKKKYIRDYVGKNVKSNCDDDSNCQSYFKEWLFYVKKATVNFKSKNYFSESTGIWIRKSEQSYIF